MEIHARATNRSNKISKLNIQQTKGSGYGNNTNACYRINSLKIK